MEQQFTYFYNHPKVVGLTIWGYKYGQTWVQNSHLLNAGGQPREALTWLMEFLGR